MQCPSCGFDNLEQKNIHHVIYGGNNTAVIALNCEVCNRCGEILFTLDQAKMLEKIKEKLEKDQIEGFIPIGKNYKVA